MKPTAPTTAPAVPTKPAPIAVPLPVAPSSPSIEVFINGISNGRTDLTQLHATNSVLLSAIKGNVGSFRTWTVKAASSNITPHPSGTEEAVAVAPTKRPRFFQGRNRHALKAQAGSKD